MWKLLKAFLEMGPKPPKAWRMEYMLSPAESVFECPEPLRPYYTIPETRYDCRVISGEGQPPAEVIECIDNTIGKRIFCHLEVDGEDSYVWPSYRDKDDPPHERCPRGDEIRYFECWL